MFDLVPASCNDHISSIYAQLGHPQINFDSFWDVFNQLREAVDEGLLFRSSSGVFDDTSSSDDPDNAQLPLSHLHSCRFGEGGIPAGRIVDEGEGDRLTPFFASNSCKRSYLPR